MQSENQHGERLNEGVKVRVAKSTEFCEKNTFGNLQNILIGLRSSGASNTDKNAPLARHPLGKICPSIGLFFFPQGKSNSTFLEVLGINKLSELYSGAVLLHFAHLFVCIGWGKHL